MAASFSKISAARSCKRLTVGSSPYTSSPTSAAAIARRISGVGFVTVSDLRSIMFVARAHCTSLRSPPASLVRPVLLHGADQAFLDDHHGQRAVAAVDEALG